MLIDNINTKCYNLFIEKKQRLANMNKEQIMETIELLAKSQGYYGRLLNFLNNVLSKEDKELTLKQLESYNFKDAVDLVLHLEG